MRPSADETGPRRRSTPWVRSDGASTAGSATGTKATATNADRDINRAERKLADLADEANRLTAAVPTRRAWERAHAPELERVRVLTDTIVERRLEATVERAKTVEREVDHGISL